jgi:hypothetical protein
MWHKQSAPGPYLLGLVLLALLASTAFGTDYNGGQASDETHTKYYPPMYRLCLKENCALKPTVDALQRFMDAKTDKEALRNLKKEVKSDQLSVKTRD